MKSARSIGQTIKSCREKRGLSLAQVATETNIAQRTLRAIENDNYLSLPHTIYTLGFVRRYAKFLGLNPTATATKYLIARGPLPNPASRLRRQKAAKPLIGTRVIVLVVAGVALMAVGIYLFLQLAVLARPPALKVNSPTDDQVVSTATINVEGETTQGAEVSVNGQSVYVDDNGHFSVPLTLQNGINVIVIKAQNKSDKKSTVERSVLLQPADL